MRQAPQSAKQQAHLSMRSNEHTVDGIASLDQAHWFGWFRLPVYQNRARFDWQRGFVCRGKRRRAFRPVESGVPSMTVEPSRLPKRRILLAEDDNSMRAFIERALVKAGYEVTSFANGAEAHARLKEEPFALLLTDIVMPQMDGIELARRASEIDPNLKIMFITGFAAVTLNTGTKPVKDAQVLSKPFHLKDLVREIDRLLGVPAV